MGGDPNARRDRAGSANLEADVELHRRAQEIVERLQERWAPGCAMSLLNSGALHSLACRPSVSLTLDMSTICWMHQNRVKLHFYTMGATVRNIARMISPMVVMHFDKVLHQPVLSPHLCAISAPMTLHHVSEAHPSSKSERAAVANEMFDLCGFTSVEENGLNNLRFGDSHCARVLLLVTTRRRAFVSGRANARVHDSCTLFFF